MTAAILPRKLVPHGPSSLPVLDETFGISGTEFYGPDVLPLNQSPVSKQ